MSPSIDMGFRNIILIAWGWEGMNWRGDESRGTDHLGCYNLHLKVINGLDVWDNKPNLGKWNENKERQTGATLQANSVVWINKQW